MMDDYYRRVRVVGGLEENLGDWPDLYRDAVVITPAGPYVVRRESFFTCWRPARWQDFTRMFGLGESHKPLLGRLEIKSKMPWDLLLQATSFFKDVWQQYQREDVLLLYYFFREDRYELVHPPLLKASQHSVRYEFPLTPSDSVRFGSFHLHGNESASHSMTDQNDDEVSPGVHVIVGNVGQPVPTVHCVASSGGRCFPVSLADIFVAPSAIAYPSHWLIKHVGGGGYGLF